MTHGLVIGKFYPPHLGHHHLIATAAAQVDRLSVLVLGARRESISIADRVRWLTEVHPEPHVDVIGGRCDVPIDLDSDPVWAAHVALMRATLETRTAHPVDVVFTAEPYGPELARRLGATPRRRGPLHPSGLGDRGTPRPRRLLGSAAPRRTRRPDHPGRGARC